MVSDFKSDPRVRRGGSDGLGHHLDRATGALGRADAAALAEVVIERVAAAGSLAVPPLELDHRVVGADAEAVVAVEAVAAREAAARLEEGGRLVEAADDLLERRAPARQLERRLQRTRRVRVVPRVEPLELGEPVLGWWLVDARAEPRVDVAGGLLPVPDGH